MKILVAQINPIIGDLIGNTNLIIDYINRGREKQADIVLFPELALTGYSPDDFLLQPQFINALPDQLEKIIVASKGITAVVGMPRLNPHRLEKKLYNSAAVIQDEKLLGYVDKILLPTYDVFDERRYFEPGEEIKLWEIAGKKIGITICEDLWEHSHLVDATAYRRDPILELKTLQPDLLLNLSASPFSCAKYDKRLNVCQKIVQTLQCPLILCNQVGANDSVIFDGYSLFVSSTGIQQSAVGFKEDAFWIDLESTVQKDKLERNLCSDLYQALVLGVRDYFKKQKLKKACLGLSGGIDSALVACIAVEALGTENVVALFMPSRFSSNESERDAKLLASRLGIAYKTISIEEPFESYLKILQPEFKGLPTGIAEENLQARIRGMLLMAFSNKFGHLVLSTGNKSETAMGYATLYGDMCGGLSVINDVTKSQVYQLAKWINRNTEIIPDYTIQRAPSAELRPGQKDSDSLPEYAKLDHILQAYIEEERSVEDITEQFGYPLELVSDVIKRVHQNEYKRRQAALGLRVSEKAFAIGRRFPIVQRWIPS